MTEATEIIDDESIYEAEAQGFKPMTAAYRSSNLAFGSLSEPLMSPVRGNMSIIEFEGVKDETSVWMMAKHIMKAKRWGGQIRNRQCPGRLKTWRSR